MGRIIRLRPRRGSLYALEETIASLHEELQFTLNYAQAMVQDRNYRAAAEVIEEQRRSLIVATKRMERAIAPEAPVRRQARVRAALVGVAATLALASGAFAAFGPAPREASGTRTRIQAIEELPQTLDAAVEMTDPATLQMIVGDANEKIMAVASLNSTDTAVKLSLLASVRKLQDVLQNPNVPRRVREQAEQLVENIVADVEETTDETKRTSRTTVDETESKSRTAPAPEPQTPNAQPSV